MKILHIIRGLANSSGTTHVVGQLSEAQAKLGHNVVICFVDKLGEDPQRPDARLVETRAFSMTLTSHQYGWSRPFHAALQQYIGLFDVVHIHAIWNFPTWCAMRESYHAGVPYIVAPHGSLDSFALRRNRVFKRVYGKLIEKPWFDRASRIHALTDNEATQCRRYGIRVPTEVLPNGLDLTRVDQFAVAADIHTELGLASTERLLLFMGRLDPKKGLDVLVTAFARLLTHQSDITLLIAGHDAGTGYRDEIVRQIVDTGVSSKIRFLGQLDGARKVSVLRAVDLFVLSSYSEGLPVAVLEAMGARLPVIITPACNLPEVRDSKAGWITKPDVNSLFQTLNIAFKMPEELRRRGRRARQLVELRFTWLRIAQDSIRIYREMSGSPGSCVGDT